MAVDEERGSGLKAGLHGQGLTGIEADEYEALPVGVPGLWVGANPVQEGLLELEDVLDVHACDERFGGGDGAVGEHDVFEVIAAGRQDGSALVDLLGIEEVEYREVLDLEDLIHAFEAESALAVEEVRDVSLFKSSLLGEPESGKFTCFDALPEDFTEVLLQYFELHWRSIAPG